MKTSQLLCLALCSMLLTVAATRRHSHRDLLIDPIASESSARSLSVSIVNPNPLRYPHTVVGQYFWRIDQNTGRIHVLKYVERNGRIYEQYSNAESYVRGVGTTQQKIAAYKGRTFTEENTYTWFPCRYSMWMTAMIPEVYAIEGPQRVLKRTGCGRRRSLCAYLDAIQGKNYKRINSNNGNIDLYHYVRNGFMVNSEYVRTVGTVQGPGTLAENIAALQGTSFTEEGNTYTWYPRNGVMTAMLPEVYARYGPRVLKMTPATQNYPSRRLRKRRTLRKIRSLLKQLQSEYEGLE